MFNLQICIPFSQPGLKGNFKRQDFLDFLTRFSAEPLFWTNHMFSISIWSQLKIESRQNSCISVGRERGGVCLHSPKLPFSNLSPSSLLLLGPNSPACSSHHLLKPLWAEQLLHPAHSHALLHPWIDSLDEEPVLLLPLCLSPSKESPSSSSSGKGGREVVGGQKLSSHKSRTEDVSPSHITVTYTSPPSRRGAVKIQRKQWPGEFDRGVGKLGAC